MTFEEVEALLKVGGYDFKISDYRFDGTYHHAVLADEKTEKILIGMGKTPEEAYVNAVETWRDAND